MLKIKINKTIFFLLLIFIISTGCTQKLHHEEFITIGALLPLTGENSADGLRALNGLMLAKKEINGSGGIFGMKLDIIVLNDKGDAEYIVQQYNSLKEIGVAAIIGSSYSDATLALAKAAEKDGIPVISPTASNPDVTQGRSNIFRAIFIDDYQTEVMAEFAHNSLNARTAVVLQNGSFSGFARKTESFCEFFKNAGGQITAVEIFSSGAELAQILGKYVSNPPDVFYCPENIIPAVTLINTAYELGFNNTPILGSDTWDGILSYAINPDVVGNVFYTAPFSFDDQDENVTRFVRNYFHTFSQIPMSGSAASYTCVYILADAVRRAGNTEHSDIISAIKNTNLDMITGQIIFDENNNPSTNVYIIKIESGMYSTYKKISLPQPGSKPAEKQ